MAITFLNFSPFRRRNTFHLLTDKVTTPLTNLPASSLPPFLGFPPESLSRFNETHYTCANEIDVIPLSSVNDGFCDCIDGSDEHGTAACSHLLRMFPTSLFECIYFQTQSYFHEPLLLFFLILFLTHFFQTQQYILFIVKMRDLYLPSFRIAGSMMASATVSMEVMNIIQKLPPCRSILSLSCKSKRRKTRIISTTNIALITSLKMIAGANPQMNLQFRKETKSFR